MSCLPTDVEFYFISVFSEWHLECKKFNIIISSQMKI